MISEERLEELIKNRQPVYYGLYEVIYPHKWKEYTLNNRYLFRSTFNAPQWFYNLKDLFETKEEAEWYFKFGNIQRTETLSLPTWDEFKECDTHTKFYNQKIRYTLYVYVKNKNTNNCRIMIFADDGSQDWFVFEKPLTKENYIEACEVAKKLFLGGEE